jgi:hypothetical protein
LGLVDHLSIRQFLFSGNGGWFALKLEQAPSASSQWC